MLRLLSVRSDYGAEVPVPLSEMLCGDPLALSVMVIEAGRDPVVVGPKCP